MLDIRHIQPLTDFLRNHKVHIARLKETRTPEVLTVNGKAEIIILDVESYQELTESYQYLQQRLQHVEILAAIREGLASAERGELKDAEQVFVEMKARYGLQG